MKYTCKRCEIFNDEGFYLVELAQERGHGRAQDPLQCGRLGDRPHNRPQPNSGGLRLGEGGIDRRLVGRVQLDRALLSHVEHVGVV